jgi:hypothetical protein
VVIRLVLATAMITAVPLTCGNNDGPGQAGYRGTLTVINRTETEVTLMSQAITLTVPPCAEGTAEGALINWWNLSFGRDSARSEGGHYEKHSYVIVAARTVRQVDARPADLAACGG